MIKKETLKVEGMSCASCALRIEKNLSALPGVKSAAVNFATEKAVVEYDDEVVDEKTLEEAVKRLGYGVAREATPAKGKVELAITGMSCASCAAKIERRLGGIEGVLRASVNLATEKATVEFDASRVKVGALIEAIEDLGYGAARAEEIP
ncbi:MAG: heavy-metal-associated domain-containing protein, partial [Firmicutes bacterium]|nr:heavy-metal-associated domain-containing protein [Bacillota bacterium]